MSESSQSPNTDKSELPTCILILVVTVVLIMLATFLVEKYELSKEAAAGSIYRNMTKRLAIAIEDNDSEMITLINRAIRDNEITYKELKEINNVDFKREKRKQINSMNKMLSDNDIVHRQPI